MVKTNKEGNGKDRKSVSKALTAIEEALEELKKRYKWFGNLEEPEQFKMATSALSMQRSAERTSIQKARTGIYVAVQLLVPSVIGLVALIRTFL
tara:strand:- start:347 stop:628 length:282 start_codon:yes stop_codon:yes gene_type:complete